jgi:hypothetical protein
MCQDRLGTNIEKVKKKKTFPQGSIAAKLVRFMEEQDGLITGEKTGFLSHLDIKVIFLPRQARDQHGENSKKARFLAAEVRKTPFQK